MCGLSCSQAGEDNGSALSQRDVEAAGRASGRAARFQIPLMICIGSLLRAIALFINDRNVPASFDS